MSHASNEETQSRSCVPLMKINSEELVEEVINILQALNSEYDCLIQNACTKGSKENENNISLKSTEEDTKCFVHDKVEHCVFDLHNSMKRWSEKDMSIKCMDLQYQVKVSIRERQALQKKLDLFSRRIAIEERNIETLNEQISNIQIGDDNLVSTEEELQKIMDDLENMLVTESIHPSNIFEKHSKLDKLQERIGELNLYLSKYSDLPPDYMKAKEKLVEANVRHTVLQKRISNLLIQ